MDVIDQIILDIMKSQNSFWWKPEDQSSMCEAHRIIIHTKGFGKFNLSTVCNCDSQNLTEGKEEVYEDIDYYELRDLLEEFVIAHNEVLGYEFPEKPISKVFSLRINQTESDLETKEKIKTLKAKIKKFKS